MNATITVVLVLALAALVVFLLRARLQDQLGTIMKKRAGSRLCTRGDYVESGERIPVVLALSDDTFYYENADLEASFELARIDEVEYDDELSTGKSIDGTHRVLRLRSHGTTFEYILEKADADKWMTVLKPHRMDEAPSAQAV